MLGLLREEEPLHVPPISELRLSAETDSDEYKQGLVFDNDVPDIFCSAVAQLQLRIEFSDYLVLPTQFGFQKVVRVLSLVLTFIQ